MSAPAAGIAARLGLATLLVTLPSPARAQDRGRPHAAADTTRGTAADLDRDSLAAFADAFFAEEMAASHVPGAVFVVVGGGRMLFQKGYGHADLDARIPVDPDRTAFRVGSVSKTVTTAALLQQVEAGRVSLDGDANAYLRQARVPDAFGTPVRVRDLLTHTAGLDERLFGQHTRSRADAMALGPYLADHLPPRTSPPGRVISYNDFGTSLAGLIVEDVTGRPFADAVRSGVFEPLGMTRSSFSLDLPVEIRRELALAYRYDGERFHPYAFDYIQTTPAAGLVTTGADMGRFLIALSGLGDGRRILDESTRRQMLSRQFGHSDLLRGRAFGFVQSWENGVDAVSKDGQATGFLSRIFLIPDRGVGFFASTNRSIFDSGASFNRVSGIHRRLTTAFLDRFFPADAAGPHLRAPEPDPSFDPAPYVGRYRPMEGSRHSIEKILFLGQETGVDAGTAGTLTMGGAEWVPLGDDAFQYAGGGRNYMTFARDAEGRSTHLFVGAGALERVPWHETARTTLAALGGCAALFLLTLLAGAITALRRGRVSRRLGGRLAVVMAAGLSLAFLAVFGALFMSIDFQRLFQGIHLSMRLALALPVVSVPFAAWGVWTLLRGGGRESMAGAVLVVGFAVYYLVLANWRLLGWQLG